MDALPPSPVPAREIDTAWSGRAWWEVCCGGCCLVIVLAVLAALIASYLFSAGAPKRLEPYAAPLRKTFSDWWSRVTSSAGVLPSPE